MKKHNWIPTAAVYGSLIFAGTVAGAGLAYGDAQRILSPNADWKVTKIAAQSAGKDAYCALAQRFTEDVVLTFARNSKNENSMAINFKGKQFEDGNRYPIILRAGEGVERAFSVKPVSNKAVIVRLGQDKTFFDALNVSETLSVKVNGQDLKFSLAGYDQGERKMYGCLSSLGMIRDASTSTPPPMGGDVAHTVLANAGGDGAKSTISAQSLLDTKARQEADEVKRIQASLKEIEEKNRALKAAVAQENAQNQERMKKLESVEARMEALEGKKEKILHDMDAVEVKRRENLEQSKELKENIGTLKEEKKSLEAQIVRMESQRVSNQRAIEDIRRRMASTETSSSDKANLQKNLTKIESENERLKNRLKYAESNLLEVVTQSRDIRARFDDIQEERNVLEARIQKMSQERAENIRTLDILRGELTSVERERDQLAQELAVLQQVNRDYIQSSGLEMKGGLRENLAQIQKQNKTLKDILDKKKAESNQNHLLLNEMRNRVSAIEKEKATMAVNLDHLETARGEILVQSRTLQTALDTLKQDKKILEDKVQEMTVERKENIEALELLSEELIALESANKKLNQILNQREQVQASNEATIDKLKKKVVELESYLKLPSEPLREIGMAKIVEDDLVTDLQFKMAELEKQKDDLSDTYTQAVTVNQATQKTMGRLNDQISLLQEQVKNLEEENTQLYTILDKQAFKNEKSAGFQEFVKLQKLNQEMKLELAELRQREDQRNEFLRETLEDEGETLKTEVQLKERIKILVQTNKGLRKQLDAIRADTGAQLASGVDEKNASAQDIADALSREIRRLKTTNQELVAKLQETKERIVDAGGLEALQLKVSELEEKNEELTSRLSMTKTLLANAEKDARVARVPEEVTRYKQEIKKIMAELEDVRGDRDQLNKELDLMQKAGAEDVIRFTALEDRLKKVTEEKLELAKQKEVLEGEKAKLLEEKGVLNEQRTNLISDKENLSQTEQELAAQREALTSENEGLVQQLAELSKEKDELSAKYKLLEDELVEVKQAMATQEQDYQKKQEELSAELQKDKNELREKLEAKLADTGEQLSTSTSYVELLKTERELALADLAKEIEAKEAKIQEVAKLKSDLDELQKAHDLYVSNHSDSKLYEEALEKRIKVLEGRIETLTGERDTLRSEMELSSAEGSAAKTAQESKVIASLKERVNKLVEENAKLQIELTDADVSMQEKVKLQQAEISKLTSELDEVNAQKDRLIAAAEGEVKDHALSAAREKAKQQELELANLRTQLEAVRDENERLKEDVSDGSSVTYADADAEMTIKSLEEQIAFIRSERDKLIKKNAQLAMNAKDGADVAALKEEIAELEGKLSDVETERGSLEGKVAQMSGSEDMAKMVETLQRDLDDVTSERDRLDDRLRQVMRDHEEQRMRMSSSSWDLEKSTQRFNEAEREIARLGTKLDQANARCEREKKEIELLLFDPEIAKQAQIDKFKQLKQEVIFAKAQCNQGGMAQGTTAPRVIMPSSAPAGMDYSRPDRYRSPSAAPSVLSFSDSRDMGAFLSDIGVKVDGDIRKRDIPGGVAFNWDTKHLYGSSEQVDLISSTDYEGHVKRYLDKIKNRCNADFAAIPGPEQFTNKYRANAYEIACVNKGGDGASAAIVFFAHDGKFTVVAHEAGLNGMEYAMDVRDYIMNLFLPDTFSSR